MRGFHQKRQKEMKQAHAQWQQPFYLDTNNYQDALMHNALHANPYHAKDMHMQEWHPTVSLTHHKAGALIYNALILNLAIHLKVGHSIFGAYSPEATQCIPNSYFECGFWLTSDYCIFAAYPGTA